MLNQRLDVARKVATSLWEAELQMDTSVCQAGDLISAVARARSEAKLGAGVTQEALELLGESMNSLLRSRRQMVDAHQQLDVIRRHMNLPTISWGDKIPFLEGGEEGTATLRAVA